jgi:hypothetical protein
MVASNKERDTRCLFSRTASLSRRGSSKRRQEIMRNEKLHENSALLYFGFLTSEDGTDRLSRNVDKKLPLLAA